MVSGIFTLRLGHDHAFAFGAHQDFVFGFFKVLHFHQTGIAACCHQSRFVTQISQVCPRHAGGTAGNNPGAYVLTQRDFAHVHIQNLFTTTNIGQCDVNLTVKTTWAQQGSIQNIGAVGSSDHNHTDVGLKPIHFHQHLVQGLLTLVITAT